VTNDERFVRVVREHESALRRMANAWERDQAAQEDLLQEILLALWRALPRFRGDASERTFVFRVAHNRALTHRFRQPPHAMPLQEAAEVCDPAPSPEAGAVAQQRRRRLVCALQRLPVAYRQVLVLSLEGLTRAEMADVLGITENNATVRLSRARRALQKELTIYE